MPKGGCTSIRILTLLELSIILRFNYFIINLSFIIFNINNFQSLITINIYCFINLFIVLFIKNNTIYIINVRFTSISILTLLDLSIILRFNYFIINLSFIIFNINNFQTLITLNIYCFINWFIVFFKKNNTIIIIISFNLNIEIRYINF